MSKFYIVKLFRQIKIVGIMFLVLGIVFIAKPPTAQAAGVVGTGTPASCTEAAFDAALVGGGTITFNCGAAPHTINFANGKTIPADTVIDGGGLITLQTSNINAYIFTVGITGSLDVSNIILDGGAGALYMGSNTVVLDNVTIRNTTFSTVFNINGNLIINNSTITNNLAAGINNGFMANGKLHITNSTISNNSGEAISSSLDSFVNLTHVTIVNNGAGIVIAGVANVKNSIIANNTTGNCSITGTLVDYGGNYTNDNTCSPTFTQTFLNVLRPLGDYGGSTETRAFFFPTAPAINGTTDCTVVNPPIEPPPNGGSLVTTDQRGAPRPAGSACDAGAFEQATITAEFTNATSSSPENAYITAQLLQIIQNEDGQTIIPYGDPKTKAWGASE